MSENLISNNTDNDQFKKNPEESDYKNLIIRLSDIKTTIALLEKKLFK